LLNPVKPLNVPPLAAEIVPTVTEDAEAVKPYTVEPNALTPRMFAEGLATVAPSVKNPPWSPINHVELLRLDADLA
jgi:hypothetical protein